MKADLYVALIHYPVMSKKGETICSAVTNLDLHDIARASRTYGVKGYYVVTTLEDQKTLVEQIVTHWTEGKGGRLNPARREALSLITVADSFEWVKKDIRRKSGGKLSVIATSARKNPDNISFGRMAELAHEEGACLITFGTAWGVTEDFLKAADYILEPLDGGSGYNHLPVRSAVSIILDRIVARAAEQ